jgi:hypothetical protein
VAHQENLFARAAAVGLTVVRNWLPDGRQEGDEWVALNPTRNDKNLGSFKFNTRTGLWADNSQAEAKGGDAVSLWAYLQGYTGKGAQIKAAKEILLAHDNTYFPSESDRFVEPKATPDDAWSGYTQIAAGLADPPNLETSWHEKTWGTRVKEWTWTHHGKIRMIVVRFKNAQDKKSDIPFTLWKNGDTIKWRAKGLDINPLYNLDEIQSRPNDPILLTEGQKKAEATRIMLSEHFVCTGWFNGAGNTHKTDWAPIQGREIWYCFDADAPGRKSIEDIKTICDKHDAILHIVYPPPGVKKGWDLADAIEEGWDAERLLDHINKKEEFLDDDNPYDFKMLGMRGDNIVFYISKSARIVQQASSNLSTNFLLVLMARKKWGQYYAKGEGGIAWEAARDDILRRSENLSMFNAHNVRNSGSWFDRGRIVLHAGDFLFVDCVRMELSEIDSEYIYQKSKPIPFFKETALSTDQATRLKAEIIDKLAFQACAHYYALIGWILLAPFCGLLRWRSNIWMTGPSGCGKSWIFEQIIYAFSADNFGLTGKNDSTGAGFRTALMNSIKSMCMDEMDGTTEKQKVNIGEIISIVRDATSGINGGAPTLHGSQDAEGRDWYVQTMACFASIGESLKHTADRNRFLVLSLKGPKERQPTEREQAFKELQNTVTLLTPSFCNSFHSRTATLLPEVIKCIDVFTEQATKIVGTRRDGDQVGTLMAGAWMVEHDKAATAQEAFSMLGEIGVMEYFSSPIEKNDHERMMDEILCHRIVVSDNNERETVSVAQALSYWFAMKGVTQIAFVDDAKFPGGTIESIQRTLEQFGVKPSCHAKTAKVNIAAGHSGIRKILERSPWRDNYDSLIRRLPYCACDIKGPSAFAGIRVRFHELDAIELLGREE